MSEKEKQELLADISLGELEQELARRKAQDKDHVLVNLPDKQLESEIEEKKQSEFQKLHDEMFPGITGEMDFMYPKWKESREEKVRDVLKNKTRKMTLGESMYPSMTGGK
jgi:hypothetical protein